MSKIAIKSLTADLAINWCFKNIKGKKWDVEALWPADRYIFTFEDNADASWFALHWAQ